MGGRRTPPGGGDGMLAAPVIYVALDSAPLGSVEPALFGGNVHFPWYSIFYRDRLLLKEISGHIWRIHWSDDTAEGYRWDTNTVEPDGEIASWNKTGIGIPNANKTVDSGNTLDIAYWGPATDLRHSLKIEKIDGAASAYVIMGNLLSNKGVDTFSKIYYKFDLYIESMNIASGGQWVLAYLKDSSYAEAFRLYLDQNMQLCAVGTDVSGTQHSLTPSHSLQIGRWYTIQFCFGGGELSLWLDGERIDSITNVSFRDVKDFLFGCVNSTTSGVYGKIYIDALRINDSYIEKDSYPWDDTLQANCKYLYGYTFDANMATIDDLCQLAEELGVELIFQIPVSLDTTYAPSQGKDPPYPWDTLQYWVDLVEYLTAPADPDYEAKAQSLDWNHSTPSDNWANLRAARGRVEPYNVKYIEIGNEPYLVNWDYTNGAQDFARKWADLAHLIKQVNPDIKCGLPGDLLHYSTWYSEAIPVILNRYPNEKLIDWISVHIYSATTGGVSLTSEEGIPWWLGGPNAYATVDENLRFCRELYKAISVIKEYDLDAFVMVTEYNAPISYNYFEWQWFGDALCKASFLGEFVMNSLYTKGACVFTLDTQQKHTFGLIGDPDDDENGRIVTPSYYLYKLLSRLAPGDVLLCTVSQSPFTLFDGTKVLFQYKYYNEQTSAWETIPEYKIEYLRAWAIKNNDSLTLIVLNSDSQSINACVKISGGNLSSGATVYTMAAQPLEGNSADPENVCFYEQRCNVSSSFTYDFPGYSITVFSIPVSAKSSPSVSVESKVVSESISFSVNSPTSGVVQLSIVSCSGRVKYKKDFNVDVGDNRVTVSLPPKEFPIGIYFYKLKVSGKTFKGAFIVAR